MTRSGTNQRERALPALDPGSFRVDERTTPDLILFAERLSRHLKYYDATNAAAGDWQPFFTKDVSAILAGLATLPVDRFQTFARDLAEYLADEPSRAAADLRTHFTLLFHLPALLFQSAGAYFERLPDDDPLRAFMRTVMARDAALPLETLVKFYKGALALGDPPISAAPLVADTPLDVDDYNTAFADADPRIQLPTAVTARIEGAPALSALHLSADLMRDFAHEGWQAFYTPLAPDTAPYEASLGVPDDPLYHQIYDAIHYNLLDTALDRLFQALARMTDEAQRRLDESLIAFSGHTPHYGLWLTFLRLLEINRTHLNTFTQRHLDFYYKDVLRLCSRPPEPDHVHLLFELSRTNVEERLLRAATTVFSAGKGVGGQEILYQLDSDLVVNRARIAALKAVHDRARPKAAAIADSRDGQGAPLPKDDPQWRPFGPPGAPPARIGFAIADRQLFLREGTRTITVRVSPRRLLRTGPLPPGFRASLTAEKGWLHVSRADVVAGETDTHFDVIVQLDAGAPPIVPYDAIVHGEGYTGADPILRLEFAFAERPADSAKLLALLREVELDTLELSVEVNGVRNVTLQNESGPIDPAKPFLPFGPSPESNAPFIVGSSEVFSKKLSALVLTVVWERALTSAFFLGRTPASYQARLFALSNGRWRASKVSTMPDRPTEDIRTRASRRSKVPDRRGDVSLFPASGVDVSIPLPDLSALGEAAQPALENPPYSATSRAGFIKLELQPGFGHRQYLEAKILAMIELARGKEGAALPLEPYTPRIMNFSLDYSTAPQKPARLLHLHPFGFTEHGGAGGRLFAAPEHEGALYIGVADLKPPQRLSLLVQTADGTANPLKGETTLQWHYLRGNEWMPLAEQAVDDKTRNLTGSGTVGIAVPDDADLAHTLLPAGLHWLRMAVVSDADALNSLRGIFPQAGSATLIEAARDPALLSQPRAAGTIAKLKIPDPAIKKISQPFPSFGGRPAEDDKAFTIRASERLRHKDRASTMWDYEHLVLEHFPSVYKVRCVNHTALLRDAANTIVADNEVKPGHVLVVTVPFVHGGSAIDRLRPYTDKRTLVAIDEFLRRRMSPFVTLEVQNPKFEEVQVDFTAVFTRDVADIAFYKDELNRAIIGYLSPWAHGTGADITFGGKWHKSAIIDFVEEQPYVSHVTDFKMYHHRDVAPNATPWTPVDEEAVEASTSRSILVSHPAHVIRG